MPSKYGFGDSRSKDAPVYKKSSGFKMKGSPMQRNFGISPAKQPDWTGAKNFYGTPGGESYIHKRAEETYVPPADSATPKKNFDTGSPARQKENTSSIGTSSKGESNVGLNTYNTAEIGKTIQTNEHMSKRKPAPTKQGSYGDPSQVIVDSDVLSGTVDNQGNVPSTTTSQGGSTSGGDVMSKVGGMIPGFVFSQINKWKARDLAKHRAKRYKEAEGKAEAHAKVSKPKESKTWQTKNSDWTPPWTGGSV